MNRARDEPAVWLSLQAGLELGVVAGGALGAVAAVEAVGLSVAVGDLLE